MLYICTVLEDAALAVLQQRGHRHCFQGWGLPELLPPPLTDIFRKENAHLSKDNLGSYLIMVYNGLVLNQAGKDFFEACTWKQNRSQA